MASNGGICIDFKQAKAPVAAPGAEGAASVDDCLRRYAYSLASARDDAGTVAEAAVAACSTQLTRWNQQALNQPGGEVEAMSLATGQPTTPIAEHSNYAASRALFYVVQSRAGSCAPPPAKDGTPEGVSG